MQQLDTCAGHADQELGAPEFAFFQLICQRGPPFDLRLAALLRVFQRYSADGADLRLAARNFGQHIAKFVFVPINGQKTRHGYLSVSFFIHLSAEHSQQLPVESPVRVVLSSSSILGAAARWYCQ